MATTTTPPTLTLNNGVAMPVLGFGVFQSPPEETTAAVETAIADGYRLVDTAASYDNEREVGAAIRASGIDRGELFITTKLWISDYGYDEALIGFDGCLRRLGLDYVDLFLLHQPVPTDFDRTVGAYTAIEEMLAEGRARAIGVSNFSEQHLATLIQRTEIVPAVNQVELHPFFTPEQGNAAQAFAATGLPLVGLTIGTDGALSARFWIRNGARDYRREWCESVRIVGEQLQITFDEQQRPAPPASTSQVRTVSAWGPEIQALLARLRVGVVGAGSVGSLVAEVLARTGIAHIRLIDFDTIEEHNLDRLLHAGEDDIGKAKVRMLAAALDRSMTAVEPQIEPLECSVCEQPGFAAALDCDVLFSCVDRPWPRKVLNVIAYAHLIPVIDGGIRVVAANERMKRADWKTLTATPGRICLECSRQFDPADVPVERDGLLDDPRYIESLPADHHLRARENVFAFSANLASLETLQLLAMAVAPHGISNPGVQTYHFVSGSLDQEVLSCAATCRYSTIHLARGDRVEPGIVDIHGAAENEREARRPSAPPMRRRSWLRRFFRRSWP